MPDTDPNQSGVVTEKSYPGGTDRGDAVSNTGNKSRGLGPRGADEALEQLGRIALREHSMKSLLQLVVDLAKQVLPGDPRGSITLLVADRATSPVYTGQLALDCDESQYGRGYGPCTPPAAASSPRSPHPIRDALVRLLPAGRRARRTGLTVDSAAGQRADGRSAEHLRPRSERVQ